MKPVRPLTEGEFAERIAPIVRIFFSVDLENSTQLKQSAQRFSEQWLSEVLFFIHKFPQLFEAQLEEYSRTKNVTRLPTPPVWKVLGDELIFVTPVRKRFEVIALVEAFRGALKVWSDAVKSGSERGTLKTKGAAWLAGFPVVNAAFETAAGLLDYAGPSIDAGFRNGKLATSRRMALSVT